MVHHDREVICGISDGFLELGVKCLFHVVVPRDVSSMPKIKWDYVIVDYDKSDSKHAIEEVKFKHIVAFTSRSQIKDFGYSYIYSDNDLIVEMAFYYFLKQGISKVAFYTNEQDRGTPWAESRYLSFKRQLNQFELSEIEPEDIVYQTAPTGILCSCDRSARKLIQSMLGSDVIRMNDMVVVGIDHDVFEKKLCPIDFPSIEQNKQALGKQLAALVLKKTVTIEVFSQYYLVDNSHTREPREVQFAKLYFSANLMNKVDVEEVSRLCKISRKKLDRLFVSQYSMTAHAYFRGMQLDKAKKLLCESELSIASVALECGFEQNSYFYKVFKTHEGITPDAYRSKYMA